MGRSILPTLQVLQGPDKGRTYEAFDEPTLIGRSSDQVQLSDHGTSRRHAEIRPSNGAWVLADLESANGTFLNGERIFSPTPLKHGDQIRVGSTVLVYSGQDDPGGYSSGPRLDELLEMDQGITAGGSSILTAIDGSHDSVILQPPETADAVAAWNVVYKVVELLGTVDSGDKLLERVADVIFAHLVVDHLVLLVYDRDRERLRPQVARFRTQPDGGRPRIVGLGDDHQSCPDHQGRRALCERDDGRPVRQREHAGQHSPNGAAECHLCADPYARRGAQWSSISIARCRIIPTRASS